MEQKFITEWEKCRALAAEAGVRMRPVTPEDAMKTAHRALSGHRESDGFQVLADKKRLDLSLEALAVSSVRKTVSRL